ncbi:DUF4983 domain-containing protein [Flavobacteriales bacterium]|nr:DUF4983 domain-containing protein [Flavobacteriales bacterium]
MKNSFLLFLLFPTLLIAQISDYELEFNSVTQDYVEMPNASTLIANSTTFSMSCWVNPQSNSNHGGIIGFRNNTDADFYLLQMQTTNTIEARFRNSSGTNYDILAINALDFNQWQHLAFTYDGSYIRLYKNGIIVDSTAANGTITQTTQSFKLGSLDWGTTGFYLNGRLDEIRLWDATLSQTEINNWMCTEINMNHPNYNNLIGYWRLNDGTGTLVTDASPSSLDGTLYNAATWNLSTSCFGSTPPVLKTYVPDDNFENYLENNGMGDGIPFNDSVFTSAIDTVTSLDVSSTIIPNVNGIADLTGIEAFPILTYLRCDSNQLTSLDVSSNTALTYLNCGTNQLTSLDVSNNTSLYSLWCDDNQLTILDVSNNTTLTYLICYWNQLTILDVSNNTTLTYLHCGGNQLTSLDVSNNTALASLLCYSNQLTSLDVSNNTALTYLNCGTNQFTNLDVTQNTGLITFWCWSNQLANLDLTQNTDLTYLRCWNNQLTSLDVSQNTALEELYCFDNLLTSLDIRNGNNIFLDTNFYSSNNPNLYCIDVDDSTWSASNWTVLNYAIDSQHYFSNNCSGSTAIQEHTTNKKLLKVTDLLGRETKNTKNQHLFYIYDDGTVEKRIVIE